MVAKRTLRWSEGVCVAEGPDLVSAALDAGREIEAVFVDREAVTSLEVADLVGRAEAVGVRVFGLDATTLARVADAQTPQPILAAVRFAPPRVTAVDWSGLVLVLHDVRDPGNAGTIIRSAEAAGARAVVVTGQSVDPFNPKSLRASAGATFRLPVVVGGVGEVLDVARAAGSRVWATIVRGGDDALTTDLRGPTTVVIGNEATGLDAATVERCDGTLTLPMAPATESLNAGVAASLVAFVAFWQATGRIAVPDSHSLEER